MIVSIYDVTQNICIYVGSDTWNHDVLTARDITFDHVYCTDEKQEPERERA